MTRQPPVTRVSPVTRWSVTRDSLGSYPRLAMQSPMTRHTSMAIDSNSPNNMPTSQSTNDSHVDNELPNDRPTSQRCPSSHSPIHKNRGLEA
ncbi:hypothetical protein TIFTF001_029162 [Ficus carica]|uniref:Uncharacterized protein n=1 Tax=Ficus carica TaxID=3494 RepID=A0AA88DR33_FICCA|nr:hypothetical protein TIFTF001_029162 [Ficus carica]